MEHLSKIRKLLVVALCCVLLVFLSVEAVHMHAAPGDQAHCPFCVAAHVPLHVTPPDTRVPLLFAIGRVASKAVSPVRMFHLSTRRIRPPPTSFRSAHDLTSAL